MQLLTIDEEKCRKDGLCVKECPFMLIMQTDASSIPFTHPGSEKLCLQCGHCVAVCPHGALSHKDMGVDECPPILKENKVHEAQIEQLFRSRRSVRAFKDKVVPRDVIQKLIDLASFAPTAHNDEEVEWIVVSGVDQVKKMAGMAIDQMRSDIQQNPKSAGAMSMNLIVGAWDMGLDVVLRNAPHVLVAHTEYGKSPFSEYYPADCATALAHVELAAPVFGLASCWSGMFLSAIGQSKAIRETLGVPEGNRCFGALMFGYPSVKYYRMPLRKSPKIIWCEK